MAEGSTQNTEGLQELRIIKSMIEKTKQSTADHGVHFVLWGWLVLAGCILTYTLVALTYYNLIWIGWVSLMAVGVVLSVVTHVRERGKAQAMTYVGNALMNLWIACGVGMTLAGLVGSLSPMLTARAVVPVICLIAGVGSFASGGIVDWRLLRITGIIWWAAALLAMFVPFEYHMMIMGAAIIIGYLIPGHLLRAQYKRAIRNEQASAT